MSKASAREPRPDFRAYKRQVEGRRDELLLTINSAAVTHPELCAAATKAIEDALDLLLLRAGAKETR